MPLPTSYCVEMDHIEDTYIIQRILEGETNLFVHIVRQYQRMIYTIVYKIIQNNDTTEDLVQEIFIKVYQQLDKYQKTSKFSTWLYRVAYNETISYVRKNKKHTDITKVDYALYEEEIAEDIEGIETEVLLKRLEDLLKRMPQDDAFIITLFYMKELSIQEICEITNLSISNVKVKLHRIRKFMYAELKNNAYENR